MPVTERDGNNGTGKQAGQVGQGALVRQDVGGMWDRQDGWGVWESGTGACRGVGKRPDLRLQLQQQGGGAAGQVRRHSRSCRTAAGTVGNGPATAKS